MKKEIIDVLVKTKIIRLRQKDLEKTESMIEISESNVKVAKSIPLNDSSATLVFREIYESIRQLGDAKWWLMGYEPSNHEISLDILKSMDIAEKTKLNFLDRFKRIRHDANYRGLKASVSQAREIIEFWDKCCGEIIKALSKEINS